MNGSSCILCHPGTTPLEPGLGRCRSSFEKSACRYHAVLIHSVVFGARLKTTVLPLVAIHNLRNLCTFRASLSLFCSGLCRFPLSLLRLPCSLPSHFRNETRHFSRPPRLTWPLKDTLPLSSRQHLAAHPLIFPFLKLIF